MASEIFVAGSSAPDGVARSGGTGKSTGEVTMTPDELRALAEQLEASYYGEPARNAADYLRAQADAQPLAWRCEVRGDGSNPAWDGFGWRHYHTTTSEREALAFVARCGNGIEGRAVPLYSHPAPAAPQAMEDANVWKQIVPDDEPQAGPKREPNPDEVICPACTHQFRAIPENVQVQLWALDDVQIGTLSTQGLFASMHPMDVAEAVRLVERAHGIGGSDAE